MLNKVRTIKNILPSVLIFALIIFIGFPVARAQSVPTMSLGNVYDAQYGVALEIPVSISDMPELAMIQFCLRFDSEKITYSSFRTGSLLSGQGTPTINSNNPGKLYFVWDSTEALSGSGQIGTFVFTVNADTVGNTDVSIDMDEEIVFADTAYHILNPEFVTSNIVIFDFCFPINLTEIEDEAFVGSNVGFVRLNERISKIGARAFAGCKNLCYIVIPTDAIIDRSAFDGIVGLTIIGINGSDAEMIALENDYTFISLS